MHNLTVYLAEIKPPRLAKIIAIIDSLGGKATTSEIIDAGVRAGVPGIAKWGVGSTLGRAKGRVANLPDGWSVLPRGAAYARETGWYHKDDTGTSPQPRLSAPSNTQQRTRVFIGHGHSSLWRELKDFIEDRLDLKVEEFNTISVVGLSNKERLLALLDSCSLGLLVLTAEDEQRDGTWNPRINVVHEAGLFQGRHGYRRAVVMLEEGCEGFSNNAGVGEIRFPKQRIDATFEQVRRHLEEEQLIGPNA